MKILQRLVSEEYKERLLVLRPLLFPLVWGGTLALCSEWKNLFENPAPIDNIVSVTVIIW